MGARPSGVISAGLDGSNKRVLTGALFCRLPATEPSRGLTVDEQKVHAAFGCTDIQMLLKTADRLGK
jgi:hypothetical protein